MAALHHVGAAAPGPVTPRSDEAPAGCTAQGFRGQGSTGSSDCADSDAQRKRLATLQARLAIAGWSLQRELHEASARCAFRAWRWGRAAELPDLAAVEDFAARVGAPA